MSKYQNITDDEHTESVEVLRERLNAMKRLMDERNAQQQSKSSSSTSFASSTNNKTDEIWTKQRRTTSIINGNFMSLAFGGSLLVILSVTVYAFYNLYHAILKKFPSDHTEL